MKTQVFLLPDLGEGLPDAEIVEWAVRVGDEVQLDGPLLSMETAKAVVDVPSPVSGKLIKIFGSKGDIVETGKPLAEFELTTGPQRAQGHDTGHMHAAAVIAASADPDDSDAGSVVGAVSVGNQLQTETPITLGGVKALPAVRALAKKLGVDLQRVKPTGFEGSVTLADVKSFTSDPQMQAQHTESVAGLLSGSNPAELRATVGFDQSEPLKGVRRNMARIMSEAHAAVVPTTLTEDADLHRWDSQQDLTSRLVKAMAQAACAEPALNAWFDGKANTRILHSHVDVGMAVDTDEGLFVAALRQAQKLDQSEIQKSVRRLRDQVIARTLPPSELSGYTIMLSNFGMIAGRYATPVIAPPCVAILAAGRARMQLVPVLGGIETHRVLPLSLTFDHRACTGGEAARFLRALLDCLQAAN